MKIMISSKWNNHPYDLVGHCFAGFIRPWLDTELPEAARPAPVTLPKVMTDSVPMQMIA